MGDTPVELIGDTLFINPNLITDAQWKILNNRLKQEGFSERPWTDWKEYFTAHPKSVDNESHIKAFAKVFPDSVKFEKQKIDPERQKLLNDLAKKEFGTTTDFREAGWLTTDGSLLDFSGKSVTVS